MGNLNIQSSRESTVQILQYQIIQLRNPGDFLNSPGNPEIKL